MEVVGRLNERITHTVPTTTCLRVKNRVVRCVPTYKCTYVVEPALSSGCWNRLYIMPRRYIYRTGTCTGTCDESRWWCCGRCVHTCRWSRLRVRVELAQRRQHPEPRQHMYRYVYVWNVLVVHALWAAHIEPALSTVQCWNQLWTEPGIKYIVCVAGARDWDRLFILLNSMELGQPQQSTHSAPRVACGEFWAPGMWPIISFIDFMERSNSEHTRRRARAAVGYFFKKYIVSLLSELGTGTAYFFYSFIHIRLILHVNYQTKSQRLKIFGLQYKQ